MKSGKNAFSKTENQSLYKRFLKYLVPFCKSCNPLWSLCRSFVSHCNKNGSYYDSKCHLVHRNIYNQPWNTLLLKSVSPQLQSKSNVISQYIYKRATAITSNGTIHVNLPWTAPFQTIRTYLLINESWYSCDGAVRRAWLLFSSFIRLSNKR